MDPSLPLRDLVFTTLRDAILRGDLEPGERLMEMQLADMLGVSRTPIREAIRMLEQEGLADTVPRRGAMVAYMSEKDLQDVLEVRDALDELAVRDACRRMTKQDFEDLETAMRNFRVAVVTKNVRKIVEADEAFHNVIYLAANNPKLQNIINNLKEQMYRFRFEYIRTGADYQKLIDEHEALIDGLRRKDEELVTSVMHRHLANQMSGVVNAISHRNQDE